MKTIPLTKGKEAIVDDETYATFGHLRWKFHHYACRNTRLSDGGKRNVYLHRLVALARAGEDVHHIDENPLNCLPENLAKKGHLEHRMYHLAREKPRSGQYRGVHQEKRCGHWVAQIRRPGKKRIIGTFRTAEEAARAWDAAARETFGPGCYQNFPHQRSPL